MKRGNLWKQHGERISSRDRGPGIWVVQGERAKDMDFWALKSFLASPEIWVVSSLSALVSAAFTLVHTTT